MSNHVHLIAVPVAEESLRLAIGRAHMKYSRHAIRRQKWWGHLWEIRYYSTPMDEPHAWTALKYVERNPVRAGITTSAWDYQWSSASYHVWVLLTRYYPHVRSIQAYFPVHPEVNG